MIARLATESDIDGILQLQALNLYKNLSKSELDWGFVTTPITKNQITNAIALQGVFILENNREITGYVFAADWNYFSQWNIFPYMVSRFPKLQFNDKAITVDNSFQYGPVCIAKALRGSDALLRLFETMRSNMVDRFPIGATFIHQSNLRSLYAHKKLNFQIIDEFEFNNNSYYILAFLTTDIIA
ncbi:MAG: GNAT family acetyltransferase [Pleurocapsa sp.]